MRKKNDIHIKDFALSLVLKKKARGISVRKFKRNLSHYDHNNPSYFAEHAVSFPSLDSGLILHSEQAMRLRYSSAEVVRFSSAGFNNLTSNGINGILDHINNRKGCLQSLRILTFCARKG